MKSNYLYIEFSEDVKSITSGQFAAWYLKNELMVPLNFGVNTKLLNYQNYY